MIYSILFTTLFLFLLEWRLSTSPGKAVLRLKVINWSDQKINLKEALIRNILRPVDLIGGLGGWVFLFSPQNQTIGDYFSRTLVVRKNIEYTKSDIDSLPVFTKTRKVVMGIVLTIVVVIAGISVGPVAEVGKEMAAVSDQFLQNFDDAFETGDFHSIYDPMNIEELNVGSYEEMRDMFRQATFHAALDGIETIEYGGFEMEKTNGIALGKMEGIVITKEGTKSQFNLKLVKLKEDNVWRVYGINTQTLDISPEVMERYQ